MSFMSLKRLWILGVVLAAVLGALVYFGIVPNPFVPHAPDLADREITAYASLEHGFAFAYPASYELREVPLVKGEYTWTAVMMADKEVLRQAEENGASEGPPLIAFQIFPNLENQSAEEWARYSQFSNFMLSVGGSATTTVAGQPAFAYRYSGLFTSDVVVVAHNNKIYMFLVDWITEDDQNVKDFDAILASIQFI